MTDVAAVVLLVVVLAALLCGHQAQTFPLVLRRRRPTWARGRYRAHRYARTLRRSR